MSKALELLKPINDLVKSLATYEYPNSHAWDLVRNNITQALSELEQDKKKIEKLEGKNKRQKELWIKVRPYAEYCDKGKMTLGGESLGSICEQALKEGGGQTTKGVKSGSD